MRKLIAGALITCVSFSAFIPMPAVQARTFDLREQSIYKQAFSEFVTQYRYAEQKYRDQGPEAFILALGYSPDSTSSQYLKKSLSSLPGLPKLSSEESLLIIDAMAMGAGVHTIEVSNVDEGLLIVDGKPLEFNPEKVDLEQLANKIEGALDKSTLRKISYFDHALSWMIPEAHAKKKHNLWVWAMLGAVGAVGVKWVWDTWKTRQDQNNPFAPEAPAFQPAKPKHN